MATTICLPSLWNCSDFIMHLMTLMFEEVYISLSKNSITTHKTWQKKPLWAKLNKKSLHKQNWQNNFTNLIKNIHNHFYMTHNSSLSRFSSTQGWKPCDCKRACEQYRMYIVALQCMTRFNIVKDHLWEFEFGLQYIGS